MKIHKLIPVTIFVPVTTISCNINIISDSLNNFQEVTVTPSYVYDGDTIYLEDSYKISNPFDPSKDVESRIRFLGVDTPEMNNGSDETLQGVWAEKAKELIENLISDELVLQVVDIDVYNRAVVIPTSDSIDLSIALLENGLAREVFSQYPKPILWTISNNFYSNKLLDAQQRAIDNKIGFWSLSSSDLAIIFP